MTKYLYLTLFSLWFFSISIVEGKWTEPQTISLSGSDSPSIGIDAHGNAIAVWRECDDHNTYLKSSVLPKGGTWSAPITLFSSPGYNWLDYPQVAVDNNGNAVSMGDKISRWQHGYSSVHKDIFGLVVCSVNISEAHSHILSTGFGVEMDPDGTAVAIWGVSESTAEATISSSTLPSNGVWSSPTTISGALHKAFYSTLSISRNGALTVSLELIQTCLYTIEYEQAIPFKKPLYS